MTPQKRAQLAVDISDGKVFGTWDERIDRQPDILPLVFMPLLDPQLALKCKLGHKHKLIAHLYEYYDKAGPRAINGCPIFWSVRILRQDDWEAIVPRIQEIEKVKKRMTEPQLFD